MPLIGFGAAGLGNLYQSLSEADAQATVSAALAAGLRYFDTAPHYGFGLSEQRLGAAFAKAPREAGLILSTKVGRVLKPIARPERGAVRHGFVDGLPNEPVFDYTYDGVMRVFESSLVRLGVQHVDILLAHDLGRQTHAQRHEGFLRDFLTGGYPAMRALRDQGVVKAIGLGVNEIPVCLELIEQVDLDVLLLAGRYTLLEQGAAERLLPECARRGIGVIVGGPYNSGVLLSGRGGAGPPNYNYAPASPEILDRVRRLDEVCDAYGVPLGAAALQFPLGHPAVVSVIPGMSSPGHVAQALEFLRTPIPQGLWDALRDQGLLDPNSAHGCGRPGIQALA